MTNFINRLMALSCAGGLLLVLASVSYAADAPAEAMASPTPDAASNPQLAVVSDPGSVYLIRDNPFFWRHIERSIAHARDAEIAGNMGQTIRIAGTCSDVDDASARGAACGQCGWLE